MRPTKDKYFLELAKVVATRGECRRRQVGAVIVDEDYRILSTGMNGKAPGASSCFDTPCPGAYSTSGTDLDKCEASHAEISALIYLPDPRVAYTIYTTTAPCIACTKALLLTYIQRIVFLENYPTNGKHIWTREWIQYEDTI